MTAAEGKFTRQVQRLDAWALQSGEDIIEKILAGDVEGVVSLYMSWRQSFPPSRRPSPSAIGRPECRDECLADLRVIVQEIFTTPEITRLSGREFDSVIAERLADHRRLFRARRVSYLRTKFARLWPIITSMASDPAIASRRRRRAENVIGNPADVITPVSLAS